VDFRDLTERLTLEEIVFSGVCFLEDIIVNP
jgi:hypothetical protein